MRRINIQYVFGAERGPTQISNPLIALLCAIDVHGSISAAARSLGLSYRHVWGELKRWELELGQSLIVWEKGHPARLTGFASKLMWAERQAQARLMPQIEALRAELERAYAVVFDADHHVLSLHASHDDALSALREHVHRRRLHLDIRFSGSVDAIRALNEGRCKLAGFHTLVSPSSGSLAQRTYKRLLAPGRHKIIGFAQRALGLAVAPGNPFLLEGVESLVRRRVRFVNRAVGSGTRLMLDELLAERDLSPSMIDGYDRIEPSHAAVATAIASGAADAGLCIESTARAHELDFLPLVSERYHLVCLKSALDEPATLALRAALADPDWLATLCRLPGYQPADSGQVLAMNRLLPWWHYRVPKR